MMDFKASLVHCFSQPLPGMGSHLELAPAHRKRDVADMNKRAQAVKSSVLILFYMKEQEPFLVFIQRPVYNGVHSGQIAFPGGRWEETDKSLYHTALREAREEIGIIPEKINFTGKLTDLYIPPSNYLVSPFVGFYETKPRFSPDPHEVSQLIEIPFSFFIQQEALQTTRISIAQSQTLEVPCFDYQGKIIWGATAMILNELLILWKTTEKNR